MSTVTIHVYKAEDGWRWRIKRKGRILADSGEAYTRRATAIRAAHSLITANFKVTIAEGPRNDK